MKNETALALVHALLALRYEIRAHQRRLVEDAQDANYNEMRSGQEATEAESLVAQG
ncbi:hypothetical protein LCGC14_2735810 [marine sediment metagenome]|uniref:Uncharacterized protein n=1 Tax=marine sediment metagenome TaxID=412755 RepID=A0A0F8Z5V1_9ZZZZ